MAERRMAEVVRQRQRFDQVFVEPQRPGQRAGDRRDFERVRQPRAMVVAHLAGEDLRLVAQPAKRGAVQDAVAVALKRPAIGLRRLGMLAAGRVGAVHRIRGQQHRFPLDDNVRVRSVFTR